MGALKVVPATCRARMCHELVGGCTGGLQSVHALSWPREIQDWLSKACARQLPQRGPTALRGPSERACRQRGPACLPAERACRELGGAICGRLGGVWAMRKGDMVWGLGHAQG
eukprot:174868-Chlamydomonas_euryale.AAC.2